MQSALAVAAVLAAAAAAAAHLRARIRPLSLSFSSRDTNTHLVHPNVKTICAHGSCCVFLPGQFSPPSLLFEIHGKHGKVLDFFFALGLRTVV